MAAVSFASSNSSYEQQEFRISEALGGTGMQGRSGSQETDSSKDCIGKQIRTSSRSERSARAFLISFAETGSAVSSCSWTDMAWFSSSLGVVKGNVAAKRGGQYLQDAIKGETRVPAGTDAVQRTGRS